MSRRVMRHRYKDRTRIPRDEDMDEEPFIDADVDGILEENRRLREQIERLRKENDILRKELEMKGPEIESILERNRVLTCRVNMNSTNSSKPPSSDGYRKPAPKSRRAVSGMKRGCQPGHKGHNMPVPMESDETVLHHPSKCIGCARFDECLRNNFSCGESRYVVDLIMSKRVTGHRIMCTGRCPPGDDEDLRRRWNHGSILQLH